MTFKISPIADQVHGRKHTDPDIRDFICSLIQLLPHDSYVDPFAGSMTFALNSPAPVKILGLLGVAEEMYSDVKVFGNDVWKMNVDWRETLLAAKKYTPTTRNSLLLLDAPRPRFENEPEGPYGHAFTWDDWAELLDAAYAWPGPSIVATYFDDIGERGSNFIDAGWWDASAELDTGELLDIYWRKAPNE